ncbi:unnamed protein product [Phytophthora fragariaefolia]|uniref:Unnamed protein product n=1 Tax=Phytophthora fragariaefolia TaxID=1490495 RepID=A0A9W6XF51_9STRA|nr:unnamed protein product [Phytophthora fragariaefolia]
MELERLPTLASELTSLPAMSWKRFASDLHDGDFDQICILLDIGRLKCETEELQQLVTEGADALSAKSKKLRFDEQSRDSLKSSPLYEILREYKDVLPDDISAELPQDKGVQHEIDLVPGTNAGIEVPAQRAYVLCQEDTERVAHRSHLQQAEGCDGTGRDGDTTKRCDRRFDDFEHYLQCS